MRADTFTRSSALMLFRPRVLRGGGSDIVASLDSIRAMVRSRRFFSSWSSRRALSRSIETPLSILRVPYPDSCIRQLTVGLSLPVSPCYQHHGRTGFSLCYQSCPWWHRLQPVEAFFTIPLSISPYGSPVFT